MTFVRGRSRLPAIRPTHGLRVRIPRLRHGPVLPQDRRLAGRRPPEALVFPKLTNHPRGSPHWDLRELRAQPAGDQVLVLGVGVGVDEAHADGPGAPIN